MTRGDSQRIADIRDAGAEIAAVVALGRSHFMATKIHQRGVERLLEIVGEASRQLGDGVKSRHPEANWRDLAGLRVVLTHRYHRVDPQQVWTSASRDVPRLLQALVDEQGD